MLQAAVNNGLIKRAPVNFSVDKTAWKGQDSTNEASRFAQRVNELASQMSRFRKQIKSGDVFGKDKIAYSGKDGVNQDDLVMCLIIAVYYIQKALNNL